MKEINAGQIHEAVVKAINEAACKLNDFTFNKLKQALKDESDSLSKSILSDIIKNSCLARDEMIPMCQDTGIVVVFAKLGYDAHLTCDLYDTINSAVSEAYTSFYLRKVLQIL